MWGESLIAQTSGSSEYLFADSSAALAMSDDANTIHATTIAAKRSTAELGVAAVYEKHQADDADDSAILA